MMDSRTQRLVALSVATLAIGCARTHTEQVGVSDSATVSTSVTSDSVVATTTTTTTDTTRRDTTATRDTTMSRDTTAMRDTSSTLRDTAATSDTTRMSSSGDVSLGMGKATDAQVAQLIAAVDRAEIEEARLVLSKTQNAEIRSYAQRMIDDHTASLSQIASHTGNESASQVRKDSTSSTTSTTKRTTTSTTTDSTRRDSTSTMRQTTSSTTATQDVGSAIATLQSEHSRSMESLRQASGTELDRMYVQEEVEGHQSVLSLLRRFGSNVREGTLRGHVTSFTDKVSQHLEQARTLQRTISGE